MAVLLDNMNQREIPVKYDTAAKNLILNNDGKIVGVAAECGGKSLNLKARQAVILACGGFEFDKWAKLQFLEAKPFYAMGSTSSTGDGLRMAQAVGARMWHMWHTHNSYGFKYKEFPMAFRHCFGGSLATHGGQKKIQRMPWIVIDKFGKRFMNEFHPAPQDTGARPLSYFDPDLPGFPRIPCYLIFDDNGRQLRPFGVPLGFPEDFPNGERYKWSRDNSAEIEKGWIIQGASIKELAQRIKNLPNNDNRISSSLLKQTISKWNKIVDSGVDDDFKRNPGTMMPINTPPYYAMEAWPVITNTQGGPEHNINRQVLDAWGNPIPRLYTAGELGSFFGHLYELSGNIGECFLSGRIAAKNAAEEKVIEF
jgi:succinate dehydrogenase/fumarate reductase flavoprotein subunit